jgi:small subunit ribosomal protein S8
MIVTDQIGDMLTRIRNACIARHNIVQIPASRTKLAIAKILKEEGFIGDYEIVKGKPERTIKIQLKYDTNKQPVIVGLERISKPGLRVYTHRKEIPRVYGGIGIAIMSTPKGVVAGKQAWRAGIGGEIICYVW